MDFMFGLFSAILQGYIGFLVLALTWLAGFILLGIPFLIWNRLRY